MLISSLVLEDAEIHTSYRHKEVLICYVAFTQEIDPTGELPNIMERPCSLEATLPKDSCD